MKTYEELFLNAETFEAVQPYVFRVGCVLLGITPDEMSQRLADEENEIHAYNEDLLEFVSEIFLIAHGVVREELEATKAPKIILNSGGFNPKSRH